MKNTLWIFLTALLIAPLFAQSNVACVGNSITYGYGIESWPDTTSYPHHLQTFLRAEGSSAATDTVGNFGVSGLTIRKDDGSSYWKGYQFPNALAFDPDTVVIELGTNDVKNYTTWITDSASAAYDSSITADYESMIDTFRTLSSNPTVFICLAPYANNSLWGMYDTAIENHVNPAILEAGLSRAANIIDLHPTFNYLKNPDWFLSTDTVHPSVEGAKELAKIIYAYLQKDALSVLQNKSQLIAPAGYGFQWYKDDKILDGETSQTLSISELATYKVSVKVDDSTLSRIVTAPYTVTSLSDSNGTTAIAAATFSQTSARVDGNFLYVKLSAGERVQVQVLDVQGRLIASRSIQGLAGENAVSLDALPRNRHFLLMVQGSGGSVLLKR